MKAKNFYPLGLVNEVKNLKKQVDYYKTTVQLAKHIKSKKRKVQIEKSKELKRIASLRKVFNYKMKLLSKPAYEWNFKEKSTKRKV